MKLPSAERAAVPDRKITEYLLSDIHPDGRQKAVFFKAFGFAADEPGVLASALCAHANEHEVKRVEDSPFGTRYVIEGTIESPDGRNPSIRAVWFIEQSGGAPRFATAYPLKRRDNAE